MVELKYTITDALGLHARPAGLLVKAATGFQSDIKIGTPKKMADAKRIMGVLSLALKCGETLTMTIEGADEEEAVKSMREHLAMLGVEA